MSDEYLEKLVGGDLLGIIDDANNFHVARLARADILVGRILIGARRVAHLSSVDKIIIVCDPLSGLISCIRGPSYSFRVLYRIYHDIRSGKPIRR